MSSMDYDLAKAQPKPHYYHQRHHTMSTEHIPTYVNRSVPTYSVTSQEQLSQTNDLASPRYSPTVQPWKRQQAQSPLSFIPSTSPRSEQYEYTTSQSRRLGDRGAACISPFRSVRRMKEPFQLRLPTSPSFEHSSPSIGESRLPSRPPGHRTLRAWRSDQNLVCTGLETFGLLPSPPLSDCRTSQPSPSSAYFSSKLESDPESDREVPKSCCCRPGKPCNACRVNGQVNQIMERNDRSRTTNVHMAHTNLIKQYESDDGQFTPVSTDSERMSSPGSYSDLNSLGRRNFSGSSVGTQRSRSGTVSSEGSWVPSSLSYCETWLQGAPLETAGVKGGKSNSANRRKCQIVQKSPLFPDWKRAPDNVMLAVASKTKPKLVDISRQSSPAMSYSLPAPNSVVPSTPDIPHPEISAFSPDTPLGISDSGYAAHNSSSSADSRQDKEENEATDPDPVTSGNTNKNKPPPTKKYPKSPPKPEAIPRPSPSPKMQASPGNSSNKPEQEELEKWWDHEWTIDQLEQSVKDFPQNMLRLTSPVIMFIRHNQEKTLVRHFRRIFSGVPENLLDCLCAALIAQNYITSLPSSSRSARNSSPRPNFSKLDTVPEKASSILGMNFSQGSSSRIRDQVLGPRNVELRKSLDQIVDNLLFTISGPADEKLKSAVLVLIQVLETKT